ncbi:MAG: sigma 54-interacting transcriptional regulator, partial [Firmicutes bacterium]|nr:sigma 54-interacting transcriptional regulator [Bacillota bacterium]
DGGTLFLDEVGEMPLSMQAKLLRAIESGEITRVGDTKPLKVDVRIIAATNRNLEEMAELGLFRKDLLYRLNIIPIKLPPLRERPEDVPLLLDYYLDYYNKKYSSQISISQHIRTLLTEYSWPGNVRELKNCVNRIVVVGDSDEKDILPPEIYNFYSSKQSTTAINTKQQCTSSVESKFCDCDLKTLVQNYENSIIQNALDYFDGNITKTAKALGVHRSYLYRKL